MKNRVGEKHITNEGYEIEIIEYFGCNNCTVRFQNGVKIYNILFNCIKRGKVRNPYHPSIHGKGYLGEGEYKCMKGGKLYKSYSVWASMIQRGYDKGYKKKRPTYSDVIVCDEWHNFQNFAEWFCKNYNSNFMKDWDLDKDILCSDCKIYSPETCCFIPKEINVLFRNTKSKRSDLPVGVVRHGKRFRACIGIGSKPCHIGVYGSISEAFYAVKVVKEDYIKKLADKWEGQIDVKVYKILYNYEIKITD